MERRRKSLPPGVAEMLPHTGHVFETKYRIVDEVGAGGFARVYRARFEDVHRDVALKILVPQSSQPGGLYPEELVQRFHREARAVSDLKSPSTITLHDFGRTSHGLLYMVFEFVDGTPLDALIKTQGAQPAERVVHVLEQCLQSLREAHAVGLLHRDIKPANIMLFDYLDQRDLVKILDFGIAKNWAHNADGTPILEDLTEDGTVMGTPRYMSPEQIVGQQLSPATDIYSLGLVTYEMLTGTPAAPQTDKSGVVRRHLGPEPFVIPPNLPIPGGLRGVVERMVAKERAHRFSSADEVLHALRSWRESVQSGQQPVLTPNTHNSMHQQPGNVSGQAAGWSGPVPQHTPRYNQQGTPQAGFGAGVPAGFGANMQGVPQGAPVGAAVKPERTFIQVKATPEQFEVDVPMRPTKRALIIAAATGIIFVIAYIAGSIIWLIPTIAVFAWGLSLVFRTHRLVILPQTGYELGMNIFGYEQTKRGPMASVVRFDARGRDEDDNTVLKLVTHEGEFVVANAFTDQENRWVAAEGNQWLERVRAQNPNPVA